MVAISLYKGNLHKVQDVPHRWPRPTPKISLKDFRILLRRRARALSRLRLSTTDVATTSNPNLAPGPNPDADNGIADPSPVDNAVNSNEGGKRVDNPASEPELLQKGDLKEGEGEEEMVEEGKVKDEKLVGGEDSLRKFMEKTDALVEEEEEEERNVDKAKNEEKVEVPVNPVVEKSNTENATSDVEKRKKEVKEKLEILNEKKHSLVQVLKQILNAEEQLKRQNSMQGTSGRPPLPLQVDTTTDSGSMTRLNTLEWAQMEILVVIWREEKIPHSYRTTLGVAGSPSRFAPGGQGHSSISVSGASYIASSPSPAASGGTSVFRDEYKLLGSKIRDYF
ncbi:hypothetical protein Sango_1611900 [Sesamum angolense]|uniref:Uncharacterized protein n=1 Tax=Sesamum angolense TaxID=2727404 RepID=A0AAE1WJT3_9LAMI|nr:hypothetical protein Sango_1611900 [Sesamum angolense]